MTESVNGAASTPGDPLTAIMGKAITAVPAVKYALGVVGVAAAAALITTYFKSGLTAALVGGLPGNLYQRDAAANDFLELISQVSPRADTPRNLPSPAW